jgi:hypothetical protein
MELVVPKRAPRMVIEPYYPVAGRGPRPCPAGVDVMRAPDAELVGAERFGDGRGIV